jgi:hypothetical protein
MEVKYRVVTKNFACNRVLELADRLNAHPVELFDSDVIVVVHQYIESGMRRSKNCRRDNELMSSSEREEGSAAARDALYASMSVAIRSNAASTIQASLDINSTDVELAEEECWQICTIYLRQLRPSMLENGPDLYFGFQITKTLIFSQFRALITQRTHVVDGTVTKPIATQQRSLIEGISLVYDKQLGKNTNDILHLAIEKHDNSNTSQISKLPFRVHIRLSSYLFDGAIAALSPAFDG